MRGSESPAGRILAVVARVSLVLGIGSAIAACVTRLRTPSRGDETSDEVALRAIFKGLNLASRATEFRGGSVIAWYGGARLDLRGATLDPAGATLEVRTAFGGITVLVPPGWRVELHGVGIFGGAASTAATEGLPDDAPTLRVLSFAIFGGIAVSALAAEEPAPA